MRMQWWGQKEAVATAYRLYLIAMLNGTEERQTG